MNLGGITVYSAIEAFAKVKVPAPAVPAAEEATKGTVNCQHSKTEWFCSFVTRAVAVKKVGFASALHVEADRRALIVKERRYMVFHGEVRTRTTTGTVSVGSCIYTVLSPQP